MPVQVTVTAAVVRRAVGLLLAGGILALAAFGAVEFLRKEDPLAGLVDESRYQAVILANGSVYFGRLRSAGGGFYELRDVFFIRQQTSGAKATQEVVPLSEELHGPENRMFVRSDEIVLVENLRRESSVAQAIEVRRRP